jgi:hypothetical protein
LGIELSVNSFTSGVQAVEGFSSGGGSEGTVFFQHESESSNFRSSFSFSAFLSTEFRRGGLFVVFPSVNLITETAVAGVNVLGRAAPSFNLAFINQTKSGPGDGGSAIFGFTVVELVDLSDVVIRRTNKTDKEEGRDNVEEADQNETNSPASVVDQESEERKGNNSNADSDEGSDDPLREVGFELRIVVISLSVDGKEKEVQAVDAGQQSADEDQSGDGLVAELQASESGSGSKDEVESEQDLEDGKDGIRVSVDLFNVEGAVDVAPSPDFVGSLLSKINIKIVSSLDEVVDTDGDGNDGEEGTSEESSSGGILITFSRLKEFLLLASLSSVLGVLGPTEIEDTKDEESNTSE